MMAPLPTIDLGALENLVNDLLDLIFIFLNFDDDGFLLGLWNAIFGMDAINNLVFILIITFPILIWFRSNHPGRS